MPAINLEYRIKPDQLCYSSNAPWQAHHECRVDRPLDNLDLNVCFQNVQNNLQVGDQVNICAFRDNDWKKLMEFRACRVVWKGKDDDGVFRTRAMWVGDLVEVPKELQSAADPSKIQKLIIKKEFGGGFTVQDEDGHVIERVKTKQEAVDYIDALNRDAEPGHHVIAA